MQHYKVMKWSHSEPYRDCPAIWVFFPTSCQSTRGNEECSLDHGLFFFFYRLQCTVVLSFRNPDLKYTLSSKYHPYLSLQHNDFQFPHRNKNQRLLIHQMRGEQALWPRNRVISFFLRNFCDFLLQWTADVRNEFCRRTWTSNFLKNGFIRSMAAC